MRFCQRDFPIDSSHRKCSVRKGFLRNFAKFIGEGLCQSLCFLTKLQALDLNKKEALAQVFSCEFCKMSKNTFFYRTPLVAALNQITLPTRITEKMATFIDNILINSNALNCISGNITTSISDHLPQFTKH